MTDDGLLKEPLFPDVHEGSSGSSRSGVSVLDSKTSLRVIMVDDDPDDIFLTKAHVKRSTVPVNFLGLGSGQALFAYIEKNGAGTIDLILLDIHMPVDSGYDVLNELRASPLNDKIMIVIFSTSNHPHEKKLASELGGDGFLVKPTNAEEKITLIELLSACYHGHPIDSLTQASLLDV